MVGAAVGSAAAAVLCRRPWFMSGGGQAGRKNLIFFRQHIAASELVRLNASNPTSQLFCKHSTNIEALLLS